MTLIRPVRIGDELLDDVSAGQTAADGALRLWWLGQSGFLVQVDGHHLLFDPYLSDSLTRKYEATDKPHVRMTEKPIEPGRLDMIDVVTSSHNHTDHLDHETLWPLRGANPRMTMVIPEANRDFVADRLGTDPDWPVGVEHGKWVDVGPFRITGVAVAHDALETDPGGRHRCLGYVVAVGPFVIFHSGDAVPYDGMEAEIRRLLAGRALDVALLPINGRLPERRVPGNFWGDEAARFARAVDARMVVPMHFEMFTFNTETPELFERTADAIGQAHNVMRCGEQLTVAPPAPRSGETYPELDGSALTGSDVTKGGAAWPK